MANNLENDGYVYPGKRLGKSGAILGEGQGMNLRDYFAGQVLAGISGDEDATGNMSPDSISKYCYLMADAMIAARGDQS